MTDFIPNPTAIRSHAKFELAQAGNWMTVNGGHATFLLGSDIIANPKHFARKMYPVLTNKIESGEIAGFVVATIDGKDAQITVTPAQYALGACERARYAAWEAECAANRAARQAAERAFDVANNEGGEGYNPHRHGATRTYARGRRDNTPATKMECDA